MSVEDRPFAGTWTLNNKEVVKHTPDCLVFLNGDITIPGCPRCNGRINIMKLVTSVSVDAGTDPGAHSANVSLTLSKIQGDQLIVDGKMKYVPGLEVHIYMKGYFPLSGQFQHLPDPQIEFPNSEGDQLDLTNFVSYPYYPVFHGVIVNSNFSYSDGSYNGSFSCQSLLHFWQYQNITCNAAVIASRPNNSPGRTSLFGHNFNNMHPYGIIYTLYKDVAGAAMAVEFALDEQSNLTAAANDGSHQLFDQVALYWEQRFKQRLQSLRMYGVNGRLFNAAQQAFLASASNRDIEKLLSNDLYADPETQRSESDPFSVNYSVAKALGLANGGLDLTYAPFINQEGDQVHLSLLDMFAFNQDIGEIGSFNVFESTYQTKMEVAQQVTEITGFEFYQDVDGDLVFKPPFFNLDTSTNRVYRLEDIDIIDYSLTQSEPQATYISVRGSWFKGLNGVVPNTGVTGKRGLYIDYKLVSQFGWRPADMDVAYTTDPRILFFIGVARLDLLNIDVNSASVTIPLRPEMRPGFPVYIPHLDCYYYVKSLSHSFSYGAVCQTSLVLTCRRSKFDAPGETGKPALNQSAIDLIKLDRPDLPKRRLIVHQNGTPRSVGFPNVVLALDPTKANPHYFPVGVGIDHINSIEDVQNLMQFIREDIAALQPQVLEVVPTVDDGEGNSISAIPTEETRYRLRYGPSDEEVVEFNLQDLIEGFTSLDDARSQIDSLEQQIREKQYARDAVIQRENVFGSAAKQSNQTLTSSERRNIERELGALQDQLQGERERLTSVSSNQGGGEGNRLIEVIQALQKFRGSPSRRKIDGLPASDVTASYFDSLLNLKSQYMASDLPGRYRYYSCSHPNPDYQGQPIILFDDGEKTPAQRTQVSPTEKTPTSPLAAADLPSDPEDSLRAKLAAIGANWIDTRSISAQEGIQLGVFPPGTTKGSQGIFGRRGAVPENLDEQTSNNLANIVDAVNEIRTRLMENSEFRSLGFTIGAGSSWRPDFEDAGSESMHALGRALDIGLRPSKQDAQKMGKLDQFRQAFELLKVECMRAYQESRVNFVNVYQDRPGKENADFIHLDQRTDDDVRLVAEKRGLDYTSENVRAGRVPGKFGFGFVGAHSDDKRQERNRLASLAGYPGYGLSRKGKKMPQKFPLKTLPKSQSSNIEPDQKVELPKEANHPKPRIEIRDITLESPRKVIQFIPPKSIDPSLQTPEAELGIGECVRGLNIAQGPGHPPQILTTDQIQTISFSVFNGTKFVDLIGNSQTTGTVQLNAQSLFVQISDQFSYAAQEVVDFDQTPRDVFKGLYEEISFLVGKIQIPNFQNGSRLDPVLIRLPEFDFAVVGPPKTETLASQFSGPTIPIATTSFRRLALVPSYTSSAAKVKGDQNLGETVLKVANAYANAITKEIASAFDRARLFASTPAEGKAERLAEIQQAFLQITQASTGMEQSQSILTNPRQEKTALSAKTTKARHAPVFPVSDEKGYEHYGAYRYGRGLSVDPGGTFEFIHQGGDPFQNVSAQTVEEFLRVLTLVKRNGHGHPELEGIRKAEQDALLASLQETPSLGVDPPPEIRQRQEILAQSIVDLNQVAFEMSQTSQGQEVLDELLRSNGDDRVINGQNWDISDTQFARRFANFSANYAKSPVFKTTAVNAAIQLRDLTSHLSSEINGTTCNCRLADADILFEGIANVEFLALDYEGESSALVRHAQRIMSSKIPGYLQQLRRIRGDLLEVSPDSVSDRFLGDGSPINQGIGTV